MPLDLSAATTTDLTTTLTALLESGADSNPALTALLRDYTSYHVVLVVVGGLFLVALAWFSASMWRRWRHSRESASGATSFERRTYLSFSLLSAVVTLLLALVVAANVSTALDPRQGFAGAIGLLGTPKPGTSVSELQAAFTTWLASGDGDVPARVSEAIDDRLSWQRPKAIVSTVLLVGAVVLSAATWRSLVRWSRARSGRRPLREWGQLGLGVVSVAVCFLLMLMVLGNTQGSLAPLSLTLFFG